MYLCIRNNQKKIKIYQFCSIIVSLCGNPSSLILILNFIYWSGILFLQQLHLWLLRDLDRKISGDGKVGDSKVILLPVIVEIYGHILPHLASWYIYLSISLEHCLPNLFFKSQLSSNLVMWQSTKRRVKICNQGGKKMRKRISNI